MARDWKVVVWLRLLVREIDNLVQQPQWLSEARDYWSRVATASANGLYCPHLDSFLQDDDSVELMRKLVRRILGKLRRFGERVPCDFLNDLCELGENSKFTKDLPTESLLVYGQALHKLLDGKMKTQECA